MRPLTVLILAFTIVLLSSLYAWLMDISFVEFIALCSITKLIVFGTLYSAIYGPLDDVV